MLKKIIKKKDLKKHSQKVWSTKTIHVSLCF